MNTDNKNTQIVIKIDNQKYQIVWNYNDDILTIMATNVITRSSYSCSLDESAVDVMTKKAGLIRDLSQFHKFLTKCSSNENDSKIYVKGKLVTDDASLIITIFVKMDFDDEEIFEYSIEMPRVQKETIVRMEEMMIDFTNNYVSLSKETIKEEIFKELHSTHINTLKTEITNELKNTLKTEITNTHKTEITNELKNILKTEITNELKNTLKTELTNTLKTELTNTLKTELTNTLKTELTNTLKTEITDELKNTLKTEITNELKNTPTN